MDDNRLLESDNWGRHYELRARTFDDDLLINGYEITDGVLDRAAIVSMAGFIGRELQLKPADSFLDIGCGSGMMIERLKESGYLGDKCWGIDISPSMIQRARQKFPLFRFEPLDSRQVKDLGRKFDKIVMWAVLYLLENQQGVEQVIQSSVESLAPGGKVLFGWLPDIELKDEYVKWRKSVSPVSTHLNIPKKPAQGWYWLSRQTFLKYGEKLRIDVKFLDCSEIPSEVSRYFFAALLSKQSV